MDAPVDKVVILSERDQLVSALRGALKKFGLDANSVLVSDKPIECKEAIAAAATPLLIVDWEADIQRVMLLLESVQTEYRYDQVPILLFAMEETSEIISSAAEFGVTKLHMGEFSPADVDRDLKAVFEELKSITPLKETLNYVFTAKKKQNWQEAIDHIEASDAAVQKSEPIIMEWAEALINLQQYEQAEVKLSAIVTEDSQNPRALHMYGKCLLKTGDVDGATGQMRKAKNLSPFNPNRLVDLGNTLLQIGEYEDASQTFSEAHALNPQNKNAVKGQGKAQLMQGKVQEALNFLKDIQSKQEIASVFNSAAIINIKKGHTEDGLKLYDAAIKALEGDTIVESRLRYNKGIGFMHAKKPKDAHESFKKAIELDPDFEDAKYNLDVLEGKKPPAKQEKSEPLQDEPAEISSELESKSEVAKPTPAIVDEAGEVEITNDGEMSIASSELGFDDDEEDDI